MSYAYPGEWMGQKWGNSFASLCHSMPFESLRRRVEKEARPLSALASGHFLISNAAQSACADMRQLATKAKAKICVSESSNSVSVNGICVTLLLKSETKKSIGSSLGTSLRNTENP
ncbi:TPA: hypothetical protein SLU57_004265 [Pseudomonas aeruginosa]|uniref:hypothetical protein n=1 Tax=Pseudomonas aeruginosa TaxID=287 RepID=UPI000F876E6F|nr:hypothetical protein [Pseudomonas aeruginosa]MBG3999284.1 hypothetical protein [Pseudomonas aeruginosa]RTV45205.1 hypothetical protein DY988_15825 [Pseudomonas aeruginosa]HEJ1286209.1 hypothetical protein [Pseudomonas aeruginosa]HEJ1700337.1 hypothetical protein [Pseudomonas aeruginosa]